MSSQCPACHRVNPQQARYCYFDGVTLGGAGSAGPIRVGSRPFMSPFVFPSGRNCKTFDELVRAAEDEWDAARDMLKQGYFVGFLGGLGRADLAQAAREAAREPDADRALDDFLSRLPGDRTPPQLSVSPLDVNLGQIDPGQARSFTLTINNDGAGLLSGNVRSNAPWLALGDAPGVADKHFSCRGEFKLPVQVKLANLRAGPKPQDGQITISAGTQTLTVVVHASRPVVAFAMGKLAGATTPRRLAELARDNPRDAAPLFEQGQVARWYENNGWTYPVQGPPAAGLGAVQQYFEALGLAKPPKVRISHTKLDLTAAPGGSAEQFVMVETDEKRAVFARALSDTDWLEVVGIKYLPNSARVHLRVPCAPLLPGQRLSGKLTVISNGNQRFDVEVGLRIEGKSPLVRPGSPILEPMPPPAPPPTASTKSSHQAPPVRRPSSSPIMAVEVVEAPVASADVLEVLPADEPPVYRPARRSEPELVAEAVEVMPAPPPYRSEPRDAVATGPSLPPPIPSFDPGTSKPAGGRMALHAIGPLLVLLVLLGTVIYDLFILKPDREVDEKIEIDPTQLVELHFQDDDFSDDLRGAPKRSMTFGLTVRDPKNQGKGKRLMYDERGRTNNVIVRIDGEDYLFGVLAEVPDPNDQAKLLRLPVAYEKGTPKPVPVDAAGWMVFEERKMTLVKAEPKSMTLTLTMLERGKEKKKDYLATEKTRFVGPKGEKTTINDAGLVPDAVLDVIEKNGTLESVRLPRADVPAERQGREGARSVWRIVGADFKENNRVATKPSSLGIEVTQIVEIVPGEQTLRYDTAQIRYVIHNRDPVRTHNVGLRFLLDTFIGANDGVPFTIPGESALWSTKKSFEKPNVPDFLLALEKENLLDPGTVANVQLTTPEGVEAPSKVLLGGYPNTPLRSAGYKEALAWYTGWDVPFINIREFVEKRDEINKDLRGKGMPEVGKAEPDSAVTLYWEVKALKPGEKREVGFSYGLGEVASGDGQGKLSLIVGGQTVRGGEFSVTALRREPVAGERLTLKLPRGDRLKLLSPAEQAVPPVEKGSDRPISTVTWRLKALKLGKFQLMAESSADVRQTKVVRIAAPRTGTMD